MSNHNYKINEYATKDTIFYADIPTYEWEEEEFEGDIFLNALSLFRDLKNKI